MSDAVLMPRDSLTVLGPRLRGAGVALGEVLTWRWTGNADGSRALAAAVDSNKNRYNILQHSSYVPIIHKNREKHVQSSKTPLGRGARSFRDNGRWTVTGLTTGTPRGAARVRPANLVIVLNDQIK